MFDIEKQNTEQTHNIKVIKVDLTEIIPFLSGYVNSAITEIKSFPVGIYVKRIQPIGQPSKLIAVINNENALDDFILENETLLKAIDLNYNRLNLLKKAKKEGKLDQDWIIEIIVAGIRGKRLNPDDIYYRERINLTGYESSDSETEAYFRELERALSGKETKDETSPFSKLTLQDIIILKEKYGIDLTRSLSQEEYGEEEYGKYVSRYRRREDIEEDYEDYEEDLNKLKSEVSSNIAQNQQTVQNQQQSGFNVLELLKFGVEFVKNIKELTKEISNAGDNQNQSQNPS
jgi:hypothetical protein